MKTFRDKDLLGKITDLPQDLRQKITSFVSDSTVAMFAHDRFHNSIPGLYGSGSLVIVNSVYGVLTAKHVWDNFQKDRTVSNISFSVTARNDYIYEDLSHLRTYYPNNGVDICFIAIPQPIPGIIKAHRTFYPIREENLPSIEEIKQFLWISAGFPYEWQPKVEKLTKPLYYYTHLTNYTQSADGWDEIELQINYEASSTSLPASLGGMSGGGIWNFRIFYNDDSSIRIYRIEENSEVILKFNLLAGVNFWQTKLENNIRQIRGVGPSSIYKKMIQIVSP